MERCFCYMEHSPILTTDSEVPIPRSTSQYCYNPSPLSVRSHVQDMISLGQISYGFMLKLQTEQYYRSMIFYSGLASLLEVKYTVGCDWK